MDEDIRYFLTLYLKIFVTCSPPISAALYLGMTNGYTMQERLQTAKRGVLSASVLLFLALIFGNHLLEVIGVQMDAFRIAAGLVLGRLGWNMIHSNVQACNISDHPTHVHEDISVVPLSFPTLVGPGAISSTIIGKADAANGMQNLYAYIVVALMMLTFLAFLYLVCFASKRLKPAFINIFAKLSGLVVLTIASQILFGGIMGFLAK